MKRKNCLSDLRYRVNFSERRQLQTHKFNTVLGIFSLWLFTVIILTGVWYQIFNTKLISPKSEVERKVEIVKKVQATPYCGDPISYIRCKGEQLGKTNEEIKTMIKIAKCESKLKPDAIAHEPNGTFSIGVLQLNDVHNKRISRSDRLDFKKNIDFGWKLYTEQGSFNAWSCYKLIEL